MFDVWTDADGTRVPTSTIRSFPGPEHCGYEATTVITLGDFDTGDSYYGNPVAGLRKYLRTTYAEDVPLPAAAENTGYSRDGLRLWLVPAGDAAYLVGADGQADRWPASKEPIYCA